MSTITINGNTFTTNGRSIVMKNGKLIVDGNTLYGGQDKKINIVINGPVGNVEIDYCDKIELENATSVKTGTGDITVTGHVSGDAKTSQGNIRVTDYIGGDVKTSQGNIYADEIKGNAKTSMGNISKSFR